MTLARALCTTGPESLAAWRHWRASVSLDDAVPSDVELLPLVARRPDLLDGDPDRDRLLGLHRRTFAANALLLSRVRPLVAAMDGALVGRAALTRHCGEGGRPIHHVQVAADLAAAHTALRAAGWSGDGAWWRSADHVLEVVPGASNAPEHLLLTLLIDRPEGWEVDAHHLFPDVEPRSLARLVRLRGRRRESRVALAQLVAVSPGARSFLRALPVLPGPVDVLRWQAPSRLGRALAQWQRKADGIGAVPGLRALLRERLDLDRASRPALLLLHAATGRPPSRRLARADGLLLDASTALSEAVGPGWTVLQEGLLGRGTGPRLVLRAATATIVELTVRDAPRPVTFRRGMTLLARTPGQRAEVVVRFELPPGRSEVALRTGRVRPRPVHIELLRLEVVR